MKKLIVAIFLAVLLAGHLGAVETRLVQPVLDGEMVKKIALSEFSGDKYFAVRQIAELYGAGIIWHQVAGKVTLTKNNRRIELIIKTTRVMIDGKKKRLDLPIRISGKDVYVPAAFVFSPDFQNVMETDTTFGEESGILTIEKKTNLLPPRFYSRPDATEIVFEMAQPLEYSLDDRDPGRIEVSFLRGRANEEKIGVDDGVVREIAVANEGRRTVMTVFLTEAAGSCEVRPLEGRLKFSVNIERTELAGELKEACPAPVSGLADAPAASTSTVTSNSPSKKRPRLVFTKPGPKLLAVPAVPVAVIPAAVLTAETTLAVSSETEVTSSTEAASVQPAVAAPAPKELPRSTIVLDAGHGGDDPGAIGPNGTREKDINLKIIYELKELFEKDGRYNVVLTRKDDTFIPLAERTQIANDQKADLFVSVHCNASINKNMSGFEVYFLNENASDPEAAATAILENSVVRLEEKPTGKQMKRQQLLWSMLVNEFINDSSELCCMVGTQIVKRTKLPNRGVKQAGFYVLRGTQMPAILVETAFLSHAGEEAKLNQPRFQKQVADAVYNGVKDYEHRRKQQLAKKVQ